ncbi:HAD family hydrolase [Sphingomonas montana]|uniref:HAD family hydrolase n=1 Tax=Sphingomonas montana TaxID=1843236 RepID=UPI00096C5FE1|nr:HAD-IB family phosphatase [Sphingomonas montana]
MTELAIYDMDRTITRTGTYTPFLIHAALRLAPWRLLLVPFVPLAMLTYVAGIIDRKRLKEVNQRLLLGGGVSPAKLAPVTASFADAVMRTNIHPGALRQIAEDRAAGRRLVLATASYRLYVSAIAERLGFDDVIATGTMHGLDDRILPKVDGENCYGPAKLRMIEAWLGTQQLARGDVRVRFYSDHVSDGCVLDWADAPFAVNASAKLRVMAGQKGWPLLDWGV